MQRRGPCRQPSVPVGARRGCGNAKAKAKASAKAAAAAAQRRVRPRTDGGGLQVRVATACKCCPNFPVGSGRAGGVQWAEYSRIGSQEVSVGDLCLSCDEIREEQFPFMSGPDFVSAVQADEEMAQDLASARRIKNGGTKKVVDEEMTEVLERGVEVERPYIFFSASEYKQFFGKVAPVGKKWPSVHMPRDDGQGEERLWYFKDDGCPIESSHRRGKLFSRKTMYTGVKHMSTKKHRFARQSSRLVQHHVTKQGYDKMKSVAVLSVESELSRVRQQIDSGEVDDDIEGQYEQAEFPGSSSAGMDQPGVAAPTTPGAAVAPEPTESLSVFTPPRIQDSADRSPAPTVNDSPAGFGALRRGRSQIFDDDVLTQAETNVASDEEEDDADDDDADQKKVHARIRSLDCTKVLDNKKLGNQERRVNELLQKLSAKPEENSIHIAALSAHIEVFTKCKRFCQKMMPTITDQNEFDSGITSLVNHGVKFSETYKAALLTRTLKHRLSSITAGASATNMEELLKCVLPWSQDQEDKFNPSKPKLAMLNLNMNKKVMVFQKNVMQLTFLPMLTRGDIQAAQVLAFAKRCLQDFENMGDLELSDSALHVVMDCLTIWRSIVAIEDESVDIGPDEASFNSAVNTMCEMAGQTTSRNIKTSMGQALLTTDYWKGKLNSSQTVASS